MHKLYRKELTFQAGEITPRFFGRSDTDIYNKGLAVAENVIIDKHGGAFKRQGLEHFARVDGDSARIFTLQVSRQRYYTLIFHKHPTPTPQFPTQLSIVAPGARLLGSNLLTNGNFNGSDASWTEITTPASSQVNFSIGEARLLPETEDTEIAVDGGFAQSGAFWAVITEGNSTVDINPGQAVLTPQTVTGRNAGLGQEITASAANEKILIEVVGTFSQKVTVKIGVSLNDGSLFSQDITETTTLSFTPNVATYWVTVVCVYPDSLAIVNSISVREVITKTSAISQQATVVAAPTDQHLVLVGQSESKLLHVQIGTSQGANDILDFSSSDVEITQLFIPNTATFWVTVLADGNETSDARVTFVGTAAEAASTAIGIEMDSPYTEDQLREVHMIEVPEGRSMYFTHPNVPVQKLVYDFGADLFNTFGPVSFLTPPPEWTGTNHPSTGTHFQGRLWLAGTPDQRETIWASVSGSPENFDPLDQTIVPPAPTDATSFTIILAEYGRIEWLIGTKNLLIGTESGEHIVTSDNGILTPSDSQVRKQSAYGSNNMQAIQVGEKVFYLTPDGRKLRAMSYQWEEDNWLSQDLTFISEHITEGIGIHRAWAQHPNNMFVLILEDGTAAVLTYDRTAQTVAWSHITLPGMKIIDIATGRDNGVNEIVLVGQRMDGTIDIETNSARKQYLDSYAHVSNENGTNVITGLDHLEGQEVRALVDGAVEPPQVVIGGQITTQRTGTELFAGIAYSGKVKTLPPDVPQSQIRSFSKRWNKVWALMLNSKQPLINGIRPPDRTPSTPMDEVEPDSSKHFMTVGLGWDDFGQVTVEQDLPVAMNLLAIYGEMTTESL